MSTGENNGTRGPNHDADPPSERTRFLLRLLDDQEHDRVRPVEDYVAEFQAIADFVRTEHANLVAPSTGRPTSGAMEFAPGRRIGRYELLRIVGEGGMGRAFLAKDPQLSREVVLKALRTDEGPTDPGRERLRREARVLGRLHHPHLAEVLDVLEVEEGVFLVMPFYDGRPLSACLAEARARTERSHGEGAKWPRLTVAAAMDAPSALRAVIAFFAQAASALHAAHEAGVVHRDLKPQNVLVRDDGTPLVLDFGLALPAGDERLTLPGEVLGTPSYMAPEQIEGRAVDARADVYALAVMLYEALTLVQPFAGSGGREATFHRVLKGDPLSPRKHQPLVPRDLEAVVLKGMEREPARRYVDAAAFARELARVLDLEPTEARPVSGFTRWMRKVVHRRRMAAAGGALMLVTIAFAVYAIEVEASQRSQRTKNDQGVTNLLATMDRLRKSGSGISDFEGDQMIDFLRQRLPTAEVPADWQRWYSRYAETVLTDPRRSFATQLLEAKGAFALGQDRAMVREVTTEFEQLVTDWPLLPEIPEQAPRGAFAAVAAAQWAIGNGQDPRVARRIAQAALQRLTETGAWSEQVRLSIVGGHEFWITEKGEAGAPRPAAGSLADARAELLSIAACASAYQAHTEIEIAAAVAELGSAIDALRAVENIHRLANALAVRAELLTRKGALDAALADAEEARRFYTTGFTNHSFLTTPKRTPDEAGRKSMELAIARIRLVRHRSDKGEVSGLRESLGAVRSGIAPDFDLERQAPVVAETPLLEAELWLAIGDDDGTRDEIVARLRSAQKYYQHRGQADRVRRAEELLERLRR